MNKSSNSNKTVTAPVSLGFCWTASTKGEKTPAQMHADRECMHPAAPARPQQSEPMQPYGLD